MNRRTVATASFLFVLSGCQDSVVRVDDYELRPQAAHVNPGRVATIPVGDRPEGVAVNPVTNRIYVANALDNTVSVIDGEANTVIATILVGRGPQGVAVNPITNRIYTANHEDGRVRGASVSVIDGADNTLIATLPIPAFFSAHMVSVNPTTNLVYVGTRSLLVIDGETNAFLDPIGLPGHPNIFFGIATNPLTNLIYISDNFSRDGNVFVVEGITNTFLKTIPMPGASGSPLGLAVNTVTKRVYGAQFFQRTVVVIDANDNTVVTTIPIGSGPIGVDVNPTTNRVYAASFGGTVSVIDGETNTVIATIFTGGTPWGVAVNPETDVVYVTDPSQDEVIVIAECTDLEPPELAVSLFPDVLTPPDRTLRTVRVRITVTDDCDSSPDITLEGITFSGPDIPNPPTGPLSGPDIQGASFGFDDREFLLRAEVDRDRTPDRTYTVTYQAKDLSGKTAMTSAVVLVPSGTP